MELKFDYKEGCYLFNKTNKPELVIYKTIYSLVTVLFENFGSYEPFTYKTYDLTNGVDVDYLNENVVKIWAEQDPDDPYGVKLGTIVEYDYLLLVYIGMVDKKILNFTVKRPLLFDYKKAKEKYVTALTINTLNGLQNEFNQTWQQFYRIPINTKETVNWLIKSEPIELKLNVNESLLEDKFGDKFLSSITIQDFMNVIDTQTFNKIPNEEIKEEIAKLIRKTLEIAKENQAIGKEEVGTEPKVVEPTPAEPTLEEQPKSITKKRGRKKTDTDILSKIDEVDPEDLLKLLEEI